MRNDEIRTGMGQEDFSGIGLSAPGVARLESLGRRDQNGGQLVGLFPETHRPPGPRFIIPHSSFIIPDIIHHS
jgi:hypothetical protein